MQLVKYHALGNDYLAAQPDQLGDADPAAVARAVCDRHTGAGADGLLLGPLPANPLAFGLRIFNPDGSEAEKSGNGLRIFSRWLWDEGYLRPDPQAADQSLPFAIQLPHEQVQAVVLAGGASVRVEMGHAAFDSRHIPLKGPPRLALYESLMIGDERITFTAVDLGNPHCVVHGLGADEAQAQRLGPFIETHPLFPNRTNVQFMEVVDRSHIRIAIWERGAGLTLASGSSSCAAAAAAHRLGLCDASITVQNPGGDLQVEIGLNHALRLTGPVERVYRATWEKPCAKKK